MSEAYYDDVASQYDTLVDRPIRHVRAAAVEALDPRPGTTVLDLGCGSGVNFPYLRETVRPEGRVVGVELSRGMLELARERIHEAGWTNVSVVRGDARRPPVEAPDAIFASLLAAFFDDPAGAVRRWASLLGPGGRLGLLDFGRTGGLARVLNPLFVVFVNGVSPGKRVGYDPGAVARMERLNAAAHRELESCCTDVERSTHFFGFATVTVGTVADHCCRRADRPVPPDP